MSYVTLLNEYFNRVLENGFVSTLFSSNLNEFPEPVRYVIYCVSSTPVKRLTLCTNYNIRKLWVDLLGKLDYKYLYQDNLPSDIQDLVLTQEFRKDFWVAIFRRYILSFSVYRKWKSVWNKYFYSDYWSAYECFEYFVIYNLCYPSKTIEKILQLISYEIGFHNQNIQQVSILIQTILDIVLRNDYKNYDFVKNELYLKEDHIFANMFCKVIEYLVRFQNVNLESLHIPNFVSSLGYSKEILLLLQEYF